MPPERTPRKLQDVSHLFLSQNRSAGKPESRVTEAVVWLVVAGRQLCRGYLAAGLGAAFARQNLGVTIVEAGEGFPNIGYYFALDPGEYLAPALDPSSVVTGTSDPSIRFLSARSPGAIAAAPELPAPVRFPHLLLAASTSIDAVRFEHDVLGLHEAAGNFSACDGCGEGIPDGIVVFGEEGSDAVCERIAGYIRTRSARTILYFAGGPFTGGMERSADEVIEVPGDLVRTWVRPQPPADTFFDGLASGFLQLLSSRRRRRAGHASG